MQEIELAGSYYEMGRQYGRLLDEVGFSPEPASAEKRRFVRNCEPAVRQHAPNLLDELRGVADAGDWDVELIEALPLALAYESGCSVVAVSGEHTVDGRPVFGRNYDFQASFAEFGELYRTRPDGRLASVGCSDHWTGRHDGINEAGLAIGHTFVPNRGPEPGIMFTLAARRVLDTCRTVPEAVAFLERVPHARNTNFLVVDATGEMAIVEASPETVTTTRPTGGFGAVTNHFVSDSMRQHEPAGADRSNSEARYENLAGWFEAAGADVDVDRLQCVLADPADGVCARGSGDSSDPVETLWSWTAVPDGPDAYLADGRPDERPFEAVDL